jgi:drug/metabolite transporter (DMT)-like permease
VIGSGVLTALGAAIVFGLYLYLYKRSFDMLPATVFTAALETFGFGWYLIIAVVSWPTGVAFVPPEAGIADFGLLLGTGLVIAAANLVSVRAFKLGDVSYIAPLNKLVPIFVVPIELALLPVSLTGFQLAGIGLAGAAIYVANYEAGPLLDPVRRAARYRPAQLALLGAALFAVGDVSTRAVLTVTSFPAQTVALFSFAIVALVVIPLSIPRVDLEQLNATIPGLLGLSALFAVGVHLATISFAAAPASIASPLINTQAILAVLLGSLLLGEGQLGRRLTAAIVAIAGIVLVVGI